MTTKQKPLAKSADVSGAAAEGAKAPIKRLELRRERVRDLSVRSGVQTGLSGVSIIPSGWTPGAPSGSIIPPSDSGTIKQ